MLPPQKKVHFIRLPLHTQQNTQLSAVRNGRIMHIHTFINILIFAVFICNGVSMACSKLLDFKNVLDITHQTVTTAMSIYSCNAVSANVVRFSLWVLWNPKNALHYYIADK